MSRAHRSVNFPARTDPKNTYVYRALGAFHKKAVEDLKFGRDSVLFMIRAAVKHAKERKLLDRGANLLNIPDILEVCLREIESRNKNEEITITSIVECKRYLDAYQLNSTMALSSPIRMGGISYLSSLVESNKIPIDYLCISRIALRAIKLLSGYERNLLPSDRILVMKRVKLLLDPDRANRLREIMGDDLFPTPSVSS